MLKNRFGSWTHGHGPMALGAWAAAARPPGRRAAAAPSTPHAAAGPTPMPMCPGAKALAHEYFDIWAHKYF